MKFIISSTVLLKNLQAILGVINTNNTLPILDDFLFELTDDNLTVTSSDLETTMRVIIKPDMSEDNGSIAIPAKILVDTLKTFPDIPIAFTIDMTTQMIEISAGEGKYKLSGHKSDEYPRTPSLDDTNAVQFDSTLLAYAINKTLFATGNDELRLVLSGIFCELTPDDVTFVATDAHKLVRYRRTDVTSAESTAFILPKKPMNLLKNILTNQTLPVTIEYNRTNAFFSFGNIHLICRLIDGKYPNYDAVIPKENPNKLTIDRHALLTSIRRVSIFANQSTHQIRFRISGQELVLSAEDIDFSNEARERLSCAYEGEDLEIGFNSKFLVEMLSNIDTVEVRLEMSAPNRAGILTPVNSENKAEDILMLVMPVMLNK
ncbi:MAG TPA: DNA polymerase III subunit beta [Bacteroidales bacterium]|nr:DNA polymerase III subunit beta [Alphaproteobacteria bacterium]HNW75080.1 DNA polymerase III subunit beta [Bacteroidales bacterium]